MKYDWHPGDLEWSILRALEDNAISIARAVELLNRGEEPPLVEHNAIVPEPRRIPIPASYYQSAEGPVPQFDYLILTLHPDGRVTWEHSEA